MIEIIPNKPKTKKVSNPYYHLTYNYMIGDANGDTEEETETSIDNPYIERYVKLLNSLEPTKGTWGLILDQSNIAQCLKEKQITEDDFKFLSAIMFEEEYDEFKTDQDWDFAHDLGDGVRGETEYSFLVFQGINLEYYDEYGIKFQTKI